MNFFDYLNRQTHEDRRAFIIHFPAKNGKTQFAQDVVDRRNDVYLLDLQNYFVDHPSHPSIREFGPDSLKKILLSLNVPEKIIIVDNPDFLLNIWRKDDKKDFIHWIRYQLRSPGDTEKTFIFMIQTDNFLSSADISNSYGESRVLPLSTFETI